MLALLWQATATAFPNSAIGEPRTERLCDRIDPSGSISHSIEIDDNIKSALFLLNWSQNNSRLQLDLISPNGEMALTNKSMSKHETGEFYELYLIKNPLAGNWTAKILSKSSAANDCCLTVTSTGGNANVVDDNNRTELNGIIQDYGEDTDFSGLYDQIAIKVGIDIFTAGNYSIRGTLISEDGAEYGASSSEYLGIGSKSLILKYPADHSGKSRRLVNLTLADDEGAVIDEREGAYVTKAYSSVDPILLEATLSREYSDRGTDNNGDGIYEFLSVVVGVKAQSPGEYALSGSLLDQDGDEVVWSMDRTYLTEGNNSMQLDFDGKTLWKYGYNGSYSLGNVILSGANWSYKDMDTARSYATHPYNFTQFVDPVYSTKTLSGSGSGDLLLVLRINDSLPVFSGRYSEDLVGVHMPPVSLNQTSRKDAAPAAPGQPQEGAGSFSVTASGAKSMELAVRPYPASGSTNETGSWQGAVDSQSPGNVTANADSISPGVYQIKIFGEARDDATYVNLTLTFVERLSLEGPFNLSINNTGFPPGPYSLSAKAINGSFDLDDLQLRGLGTA